MATKILGIEVVRHEFFIGRCQIIAKFTVDIGGIVLGGCALGVHPNGWRLFSPEVRKGYSVRISNPELRDEVTEAALSAFRALGGDTDSVKSTVGPHV